MNAFDIKVKELRNEGLSSDEILEELSRLFQQKYASGEMKIQKIKEVLDYVRVPNYLLGYNYWVEALKIYTSEGRVKMTKGIYPRIAEKFQVTPHSVERTMRTAKDVAMNRWTKEQVQYLFGTNVIHENETIENRQFLAALANKIS